MALSGTVKTNSDSNGRYYQLTWTATQSTANNTSTISWTLSAQGYSGNWVAERTLYVTIDGSTEYSKSDRVERTVGNIKSGTKTITHNSNGTRSFVITVGAAVYGTTVNCKGSGTFALNSLGRASSLAVPDDGTLGVAMTLTADKKVSSFTHTLTWESGSYSGTIATKSSATSWSFTPPLNLANNSTMLPITGISFTLSTYNGNTLVGSTTEGSTLTIPSSVAPTCSISVSDPTGYSATYGGYIQSKSRMEIQVTATPAYGSQIKSYSIIANGSSYSENPATTNVIISSGNNTITAKATDRRSRTGTATTTINVIPYSAPSVTLSVSRCDQNGTANMTGSYCKVTYKAVITPLSNKNTKALKLRYKKSTDQQFTFKDITMSSYTQEGSSIFAADDANTYNVQMVATDAFESTTTSTELSTGFSILHIAASGKGLAIGKISQSDKFEVGMESKFCNAAEFSKAPHFTNSYTEDIPQISNGNCNDIKTSGHYYAYDGTANKPENKNGWLTVKRFGNSNICYQEFVTYDGKKYFRNYYTSWSDWTLEPIGAPYIKSSTTIAGTSAKEWKYRKWSDGTVEAWKKIYAKSGVDNYVSSPFVSTTRPAKSGNISYVNVHAAIDSDLIFGLEQNLNIQITIYGESGILASNLWGVNTDTTNKCEKLSFNIWSMGTIAESTVFYPMIYIRAREGN